MLTTNQQAVRLQDEESEGQSVVMLSDFALNLESKRVFRDDTGQMTAPVTIAREGTMNYLAKDCGDLFKDLDPNAVVKVHTSREVLQDAAHRKSYENAPVTLQHPAEDVTVANAKDLSHGHIAGIPTVTGGELQGMVVLNTKEAIDFADEHGQVSSGHTATLVRVEGKEWDAEKRNITGNHLALVEKGRAGTARIHDKDSGDQRIKDDQAKITLQDEQIASLQGTITALEAKLEAAEDSAAQLKQKLADAHDDSAQDAIKEAVTVAVAARVKILTQAARFLDADLSDKSDTEIKREVLSQQLQRDYDQKSDEFVEHRFDALLEELDAESAQLQQAFGDHAEYQPVVQPKKSPGELARERAIRRSQHVTSES